MNNSPILPILRNSHYPLDFNDPEPSKWFLQEADWQLGDFVMATPMLRALANAWNKPIPVYFETPYLADLFTGCPFIRRLNDRPRTEPFGDNKSPRTLLRDEDTSDYEAHHNVHVGCQHRRYDPWVPTYPDLSDLLPKGIKLPVALFFGCYEKALHNIPKKRIEPAIITGIVNSLLEVGATPVLLGTVNDGRLYWHYAPNFPWNRCVNRIGSTPDIHECLATLQLCKAFISNDTGLYHVAAAMGKPGIVLWHESRFQKCPSESILHHRHSNKNIETTILNVLVGLKNIL